MAESFFATLECELIDRRCFRTPAQARRAIFQFLDGGYHATPRHSALGYLSPNDFERAAANIAPVTGGEPLPSDSDSSMSTSMSPHGDSPGRATLRGILHKTSAIHHNAPSESIHHPTNHERPYLSTESG